MRIKDYAWRLLKGRKRKHKNLDNYISNEYKKKFGVALNLKNPETFYEKVNYLKIHYVNPNMKDYVDKIKVKEMLVKHGYEDNCAKLLGSFDSFKDFKSFLKKNESSTFVVKLNNTSGDVYFYDNKLWRDKHGDRISRFWVFKYLKIGLKTDYYYFYYENQYKGIKPKIMCESYLPSLGNHGLDEFKFFTNYGKIKMINVVFGRQDNKHIKEIFTDENLRSLGASQGLAPIEESEIIRPASLESMKDLAMKMTKDFPMARVDLMVDKGNFYFCELTFYDCGGLNIFKPEEKNKQIGDLFDISKAIEKRND